MFEKIFSVVAEWVSKGLKTGCFIGGVFIVSRLLCEAIIHFSLYPLNISEEVLSGWNVLVLLAVAFLIVSLVFTVAKKVQGVVETRKYKKHVRQRKEQESNEKFDYLNDRATEDERNTLLRFVTEKHGLYEVQWQIPLNPTDVEVASLSRRKIIYDTGNRNYLTRMNMFEMDPDVHDWLVRGIEQKVNNP